MIFVNDSYLQNKINIPSLEPLINEIFIE